MGMKRNEGLRERIKEKIGIILETRIVIGLRRNQERLKITLHLPLKMRVKKVKKVGRRRIKEKREKDAGNDFLGFTLLRFSLHLFCTIFKHDCVYLAGSQYSEDIEIKRKEMGLDWMLRPAERLDRAPAMHSDDQPEEPPVDSVSYCF